jgi:lysine-N-methylase
MSVPIHPLPVLQNWDCKACGRCCHDYQVPLTDEERRRIESQGWHKEPEFAGRPLFARLGPWWSPRYRLAQREGGACVFLSEQGRCRIHERFGSEGKPLACRVYPFVLVPARDHWRVSLRFDCPEAAHNRGRPVAAYESDLVEYTRGLEQRAGITVAEAPPPRLDRARRVDWPDALHFVNALLRLLRDRRHPVEYRLRRCLGLARVCRAARFDKVTGGRLVEFLDVVAAGLEGEVPPDPAWLAPPSQLARLLFRFAVILHVRKDHGVDRTLAGLSRAALVRLAWRFARGRGPVPRVHARLPETTFERLEEPAGPLPAAADEVLERYYLVKVGSLQFTGPTNFGLPFWQGLASLLLTYPIILWVSRAFTDRPREEAVTQALSMVDMNFGFNRLLGSWRQRFNLNTLFNRGELERLIAWYSR